MFVDFVKKMNNWLRLSPVLEVDNNLQHNQVPPFVGDIERDILMKIVNSLKTIKNRDKNCTVVRRKGRVYVINKRNPRFKARQG